MTETDINCDLIDQEQHLADVVMNGTSDVPTNHNWGWLEFQETYYIKHVEQLLIVD